LAKKYSSKAPKCAEIWIARLKIEKQSGDTKGAWEDVWNEARKNILAGSGAASDDVWLWGLNHTDGMTIDGQMANVESLIREASSKTISSSLIDQLLVRYVGLLLKRSRAQLERGEYKRGDATKDLQRFSTSFALSAKAWEAAFDAYSSTSEAGESAPDTPQFDPSDVYSTLRFIYDKWRLTSPECHSEAALKWALWLLEQDNGAEAGGVVATARIALDGAAVDAFEKRWTDIINRTDGEEGSERQEEAD